MYFWTPCNLGTVRDRYINPYIFVNNIKRRIQIRDHPNLKIQIPNGQIFKILTVKNSNRVITGEQSSKHVYNIPNPLGHHIWSILSLSLDKIWGGAPGPAVQVQPVWYSISMTYRLLYMYPKTTVLYKYWYPTVWILTILNMEFSWFWPWYWYGWTDDPTPPHEWVEAIVYTWSDDLSGVC